VTENDSGFCSDTSFYINGVQSLRFSTKTLLMPYFKFGTSLSAAPGKAESDDDRLKASVV
jgi:hypothetical protein